MVVGLAANCDFSGVRDNAETTGFGRTSVPTTSQAQQNEYQNESLRGVSSVSRLPKAHEKRIPSKVTNGLMTGNGT